MKLKKIFITIALFIIISLINMVNVYGINLELRMEGVKTIGVGQQVQFYAYYDVYNDMPDPFNPNSKPGDLVDEGDNYTEKVIWKSSNNAVATVDSKGKVTGVATGKAIITAELDGETPVKLKVEVVKETQKELKRVSIRSFDNDETFEDEVSPEFQESEEEIVIEPNIEYSDDYEIVVDPYEESRFEEIMMYQHIIIIALLIIITLLIVVIVSLKKQRNK